MKKILLALLLSTSPAAAQFATTTTTAPTGDSTNRIASTSFVQQNIASPTNLSSAFDSAFCATRGSLVERSATGWACSIPGTSGLPWVSNGAGADPAYQALTNSGLANMAAGTVKCRETGNGTGAPQDCGYPVINITDAPYNADPTGSADSTTAIQNAINALPVTGGDINGPCGTYKISSTVTIGNGTTVAASTRYGVRLIGIGGAGLPVAQMFTGFPTTPCVVFKWAGGASPMLQINGPLQGFGIQNIAFDGNSASNRAIQVVSAQFGDSANLNFSNFTDTGLYLTTLASFSTGNADTLHNSWRNITVMVPAASGAKGIVLTGGNTGQSNTDYNTFINTTIVQGNAANFGIYHQLADS